MFAKSLDKYPSYGYSKEDGISISPETRTNNLSRIRDIYSVMFVHPSVNSELTAPRSPRLT